MENIEVVELEESGLCPPGTQISGLFFKGVFGKEGQIENQAQSERSSK